MSDLLASLRARGVLAPLDEHFARTLARLAGEARPEVLLAGALASRQVGRGHVCLDLERPLRLVDDEGKVVEDVPWPEPAKWTEALRASRLVSTAARPAPLVLDACGRLYLRRYWEYEERVAEALLRRAAESDDPLDAAVLRQGLDRLFPRRGAPGKQGDLFSPPVAAAETDWQRIAAATAVMRRLTVISGGPGTGKTFTVVKILALLVEQALAARRRPPRMTLVAPTGKAAARLTESIRQARAALAVDEKVRAAIPDEAATIHRALGASESGSRFRHDAENPLVTDLVLVDEASMVDLALMARLLDALPPLARLILLGDKDQLASVEAGAVLGDVCNTGGTRRYSSAHGEALAAITGEKGDIPLFRGPFHETKAGGPGKEECPLFPGIRDSIVELTRSYRYRPESAIGRLAAAVRGGDADTVLALLESPESDAVALIEPPSRGGVPAVLAEKLVHGFRRALEEEDPARRLAAFERFRVLCAHRRGPGAVETANQMIEASLRDAGLVKPTGSVYPGRPILVTRNDYALGLFNGDVGLLIDDPADPGRVLAFFPGAGAPRLLSPSRLPPHETAFAMSVHKSQGSEFDEVVVLLPETVSPVLSRELLYTAATRARTRVTISARREIVRYAVEHPIERVSGLRERLWG